MTQRPVEIRSLNTLKAQPKLLRSNGADAVEEFLSGGSAQANHARVEAWRRRVEGEALTGMTPEDLRVFLYNASEAAVRSWNAEFSFLGKIGNRMSSPNPGYVTVPGRILQQLLACLDDGDVECVDVRDDYLLRADIARELCAFFTDQRESA